MIRPREDDDLAGLAAALVAVHRTDGYPVEGVDDPVGWLTGSAVLAAWVAELDGEVVGHVALSDPAADDAAAREWRRIDPTSRPVVLGRLFVTRSARRRALGAALLTAATGHARSLGRRPVLDVMAKDAAAVRLYERAGWQRIGTAEHDTGRGGTVDAYLFAGPAPATPRRDRSRTPPPGR